MSKRAAYICAACALVALAAGAVWYRVRGRGAPRISSFADAGRPARIEPDYAGTTIPPNIAPLNFVLSEPGRGYSVTVRSTRGQPIEVSSCDGRIIIPEEPWRRLLDANRGEALFFEPRVRGEDGCWTRFQATVNTIAREDIDGYLAYRLITPIYNVWKDVGIYQRALGGFDESVVLHNSSFEGGCVNCHTFYRNTPAKMLIDVRSGPSHRPPGGMVVVEEGGQSRVVDTKSEFNAIPAVYLAWHPSGEAVAFSSNKITQFFHSVGENREVFDHQSDLGLYRLAANTVTSTPQISDPHRMETYPTWSPDGKFLYFCSAPQLSIRRHEQVKYDLMRIGYDLATDTWGKAETILSSDETQLSVTFPRVSPDGRYVLFCMCDYGCFSIYRPDSDLYLMDLESKQYRRLDINSDRCESWHCWSSNGRWIVFSSKRRDGLLAKPYFSYFDESGKFHKPILLPQADPTFYDSFLKTYNVPEFITGPVAVSQRDLDKLLYSKDKQIKALLDPRLKAGEFHGPGDKDAKYEPGPGG